MRRAHSLTVFIILNALAMADAATADVLIKVNKANQRLTVAVDGVQKYDWPVSTARAGYVTPNGEYRPVRLDRTWYSRKYYNSPMPYSIFFHGGYAIHGSFERAEIGHPASHGCVRLDPKNAAVLFDLVRAQGRDSTRILIGDTGSSKLIEAHSRGAGHLISRAAEQRLQDIPYSPSLAGRSRAAAYAPQPSPVPSDLAGPPPLVDPFSELISYVRNHND